MDRRLLIVCVVLSACLATAWGQRPRLPGESWVALFDGTDLSHWVKVGKEKWEVEDGVIHGQGITDEYGYLRTKLKYKDFHMFLRFKCLADGNSGVYFHTDFTPGTVDVSQGRQFEIDRKIGRHTGGVYGDGRGWMAWPAPEFEPLVRPHDWNEFLLKVEGNRYVCYLNGIKVLDFTNPKPGASDGYIALQLHSGGLGDMMFKDIWVRDLSK
jgi:hypothetical protein